MSKYRSQALLQPLSPPYHLSASPNPGSLAASLTRLAVYVAAVVCTRSFVEIHQVLFFYRFNTLPLLRTCVGFHTRKLIKNPYPNP